MPTYQVKFEGEYLTTIRNYFALSVTKVIDRVLDREAEDWVAEDWIGEMVILEIRQLEIK